MTNGGHPERRQRHSPAPAASGSEKQMNHTSRPDHDTNEPDGARAVHPDGAIDEPQRDGHDGHDGPDSRGDADSPVAGAGTSQTGDGAGDTDAPVQDKASPSQGLGPSDTGTGSPVQEADSPEHGLGGAAGHENTPGTGSPVQDADSPEHGTGS